MDDLSHIFLHVMFCAAIAHAPAGSKIPLHVTMTFHNKFIQIDKVYEVSHEGPEGVVEFDVPSGIYRMHLDVAKPACSATDFVNVLEGHNRNISETLADGPDAQPNPALLMEGTAPTSFLYVKPSFVVFNKDLKCDQPIEQPLAVHSNVEYDQGAYHVWLYEDPTMASIAPVVLALKLQTPTSTAHYIRVKIPYPTPWGGWPDNVRFDVTEDMVDSLATEKVDVLLCPKLWLISAG